MCNLEGQPLSRRRKRQPVQGRAGQGWATRLQAKVLVGNLLGMRVRDLNLFHLAYSELPHPASRPDFEKRPYTDIIPVMSVTTESIWNWRVVIESCSHIIIAS